MKIYKEIDISQEVEIDISAEDINLVFETAPTESSLNQVLRGINNLYVFLKGVPDSIILELSDDQRRTISKCLLEQMGRYNLRINSDA